MQTVEVVGAAIVNGNKVLAAQRSEYMKAPLKWEFAGGKVEAGETHQQALKRELQEELGVKIEVQDYIATGYTKSGDREIHLHIYRAEILDGIPTAKEHSQLKWVDIDELGQLDWAEADIPACNKLLKLNML